MYFTSRIILQYFFALTFILPSMNCINANLDNPCDFQSESFLSTILFKSILNDTTAHCGVSIKSNPNSTEDPIIKTLFEGNSANHSLLIWEDGNAKAWGNGNLGQLGYNSINNIGDGQPVNLSVKDSPFLNLGGTASEISGSSNHSCALLTSGDVRCWGDGANGRLGYDSTEDIGVGGSSSTIITAGNVPLGVGVNATQISNGNSHTCALLATGAVRCWGLGENGRLGYNSISNIGAGGVTLSIDMAGDVDLGGTATQISTGGTHTCALLTTGAVRCWGRGENGQLGYNSIEGIGAGGGTSSIITAGDVPLGGTATQISAGGNHTCALLSSGSIRCWGWGSSGQLGYNSNFSYGNGKPASKTILEAGDVPLGSRATQISGGRIHTCALLSSGSVRCWGSGTAGRLGYNNIDNIADGQPGSKSIIEAGDLVLE